MVTSQITPLKNQTKVDEIFNTVSSMVHDIRDIKSEVKNVADKIDYSNVVGVSNGTSGGGGGGSAYQSPGTEEKPVTIQRMLAELNRAIVDLRYEVGRL